MELFICNQEVNTTKDFYRVIMEQEYFVELPKKDTIPASLTRKYLFGTHPPNEYKKSKRKRVKQGYLTEGIQYINSRPIVACAVPYDEELNYLRIALLDGHNRVRLLGMFENADYLQINAYIINIPFAAQYYETTPKELTTSLNARIEESIYAFDRHLAHYHQRYKQILPKPIHYSMAPFIWEQLYPQYSNNQSNAS